MRFVKYQPPEDFIRFVKYQETKNFLLQKTQPPPLILEFASWFFHEYSANLLNIDIYAYEPNSQNVRKYRLSIIIETRTDNFKDIGVYLENIVSIKNKFIELSTKYNFANEHKINNKNSYIERATKRNFAQLKKLENIVDIPVYIFPEVARLAIIKETLDEATTFLKSKYPEIFKLATWKENLVVMYHSGIQAKENEEKGVNQVIMNDYFKFIKRYDELNLFSFPIANVHFTGSGGHLHDYFR